MEALRCLCAEAWRGDRPERTAPDGEAAARALGELGLVDVA
jgi:hypothetical protein